MLYPLCTSFPTYILSLPCTISWLLGILIDRRSPEPIAKATPLALFLMEYASVPEMMEQAVVSTNPPMGTYNGLTVTGIHCALIWGHGECCHGDRWQSHWRVGWQWLKLVDVCFVFCVLWLLRAVLTRSTIPTLKKVDIRLTKMADFCTLVDKSPSPNHPNVKACATSSCYEDVAHALTFGWNGSFGSVTCVYKRDCFT
jgi:hypothetical protein